MTNIKGKSTLDETKKKIIITVEVAVLLTLFIVMAVIFNEGVVQEPEVVYSYATVSTPLNEGEENTSSSYFGDEGLSNGKDITGNTGADNRLDDVMNVQNTSNNKELADPSGWSKARIVSTAKDAVNKTKMHQGALTVNHKEGFTASVTQCSAGGIVRSVVDLMIGWVVKPVEETLLYQNGKAINSEGETIPIILPKRNSFTLDENGVESASVTRVGNEYVIKLNLVEESVGMYDVPQHNASAVGYLDVGSFDLSFMEIDAADIVYKGTSIELRINADGYVTSASYKIPLSINGSAHKGSISGSATIEGEQTEEWILNW